MNEDENVNAGVIHVSPTTLTFGGTVILMRNICRLRSYSMKKNPKQAYGKFCVSIVLFAGAIFAFGIEPLLGSALLIASIVLTTLAFRSLNFKRFGLSIETNGGTSDFIVAKGEKFAQNVLTLINRTIENSDGNKSFTINMDNRTITEGDRFDNISGDVKIATRESSINE